MATQGTKEPNQGPQNSVDNHGNNSERKNTVELLGYYGGDKTHAMSAWTSTSRNLTEDKKARIGSLLKMLATSGHETPFEKSSLHFLVTTDIGTHIHIIKHRIGVSVNAESARYKELKDDKFYVPFDWDEDERNAYVQHVTNSFKLYHDTLDRLISKGVSRKRAKEAARFYLPYGNQISADVMFNFRSFVNFLKLRYSKHAQREVSNLAKEMLICVSNIPEFKESLLAFSLIDNEGNIRPEFE